jgi:uncharacterized protein (TIGR03000 family)
LAVACPALAQHGHSAPAPAPAPRPSFSAPATSHASSTSLGARDVIGAFGYNANLGSNSAAPLSPRFNLSTNIGFSSTPPVQYNPPLNSAPNTFFPSKTTGFSTSPLFPYSSPSYPYGYGFLAREPNDETQRKPLVPMREYAADPNSATMKVVVPANAEIWFEGSKTGQSGTTRTFVSPPLEPGRGFTYEVRARWTEGGKEVERTRQLHVHAGENVQVDFGAKK